MTVNTTIRMEMTEKKEEYPKRVILFKQQRGRIKTTEKRVITKGRVTYQGIGSEIKGEGEGEGEGKGEGEEDGKGEGEGEGEGEGIRKGVGVGVGVGVGFVSRRMLKTGTMLSAITTR